ncbi:hypothetical protein FEM33_04575 [Dyadobacter flavalbus]|uniref:Glycosyltransferase RgtA/B/C/D-like domain-containing protein n=1 Tax=Dyadobacter flavalbus TaxID=2579942 RepID=A0A5M8QXF2_9BACT|nr:hypothetical protein [Dyadobacter flavalbus]KAA6440947.1 hypothetical protein FEM33_04575 [Dyadobacter flavalbus]
MRPVRYFSLITCICIICSYFYFIIQNTADIPNGDDLYCLLLFTQAFKDAKSWKECFRLLFEQWVEHRIVYSRFTALVSYWIHGAVNFKSIALIGNFSLLGITFLFYKLLHKIQLSVSYLIPAVLTLFSPVMYEGNLWAGASTVYMPVCLMGIISIFLLAISSPITFVLAILIAILATYSFGNGMFVFVAGAVVLFKSGKIKHAAIWITAGSAAVAFYFRNFQMYSATNAFGWTVHFKYPIYLFNNFFAFVGGTFNYVENVNGPVVYQNFPALLAGIILTAVLIWGIIKILLNRAEPVQVTWAGMAIFIMITSAVIAFSRTQSEQMTTISSRYKIYSMAAFLLVYLWCLIYYDKRKIVAAVFTGISAALLLFNYYVYYEKFVDYQCHSLAGLYNYNHHGKWIIYSKTAYFEKASKFVSDTIKKNPEPVFHFHPIFPELTHQAIDSARTLESIEVTDNTDSSSKLRKSISFNTNEYPSTSNQPKGIYLVTYNEKNIFLSVANPLKNGRLNMIKQLKYFKDGFYAEEDMFDFIPKGEVYKFAVFCPEEKEQVRLINYQITGK